MPTKSKGIYFYIFGSAVLSLGKAYDLDILVVYDKGKFPPDQIYQVLGSFFVSLKSATGLHVHPTVLTKEEEKAEDFICKFKCIPYETWMENNTRKVLD